jgi:hypothetical protein
VFWEDRGKEANARDEGISELSGGIVWQNLGGKKG